MQRSFISRLGTRLTLLASGLVLWANTGCTLGDAVLDGFFGGISDTVASVITSLIQSAPGG